MAHAGTERRSPSPTARSAPCPRAPRPRPASGSARPAAQVGQALTARQAELEAERDERILVEEARRRHPARRRRRAGARHPLELRSRTAHRRLRRHGLGGRRGPRGRDEWLNFDALNLGPDHPARQMQDTFFVDPRRVGSRAAHADLAGADPHDARAGAADLRRLRPARCSAPTTSTRRTPRSSTRSRRWPSTRA